MGFLREISPLVLGSNPALGTFIGLLGSVSISDRKYYMN